MGQGQRVFVSVGAANEVEANRGLTFALVDDTPAITGRGAWTSIGMPAKSPYYSLGVGSDAPPATDLVDNNVGAVRMGVIAIQRLVGIKDVTGYYGSGTVAMVKSFQKMAGLEQDGVVGPLTARAMAISVFVPLENKYKIPGHYALGVAEQESLFDMGAVGYSTPADKGWAQFNSNESGYTYSQEFDPRFAALHLVTRMAAAGVQFDGKGSVLQHDCMIAQHNSPLWASQWYTAGHAPNATIAKYVKNVKAYGAQF